MRLIRNEELVQNHHRLEQKLSQLLQMEHFYCGINNFNDGLEVEGGGPQIM